MHWVVQKKNQFYKRLSTCGWAIRLILIYLRRLIGVTRRAGNTQDPSSPSPSLTPHMKGQSISFPRISRGGPVKLIFTPFARRASQTHFHIFREEGQCNSFPRLSRGGKEGARGQPSLLPSLLSALYMRSYVILLP